MARRTERKWKKHLGSRTWGAGNTKNRRGSGSRGGKGYAGSHKHRWTWILKYEPDHFGRSGFVNRNASEPLDVMNISDINSRALGGKLQMEGSMPIVDFKGKVLGAGSLTMPVLVRAQSFSEIAKQKIEKAGGKAEQKTTKRASKVEVKE